ncbi:MAG: hypothetical protein Q8K63_00325, partial [Acidimicrobiales bacterium]|nr:hypothetical protein [Acidimicrobiales bacterium]
MASILACVLVTFFLGVVVGAVGVFGVSVVRRARPQLDTLTGIPTRQAADRALTTLGPDDAVV